MPKHELTELGEAWALVKNQTKEEELIVEKCNHHGHKQVKGIAYGFRTTRGVITEMEMCAWIVQEMVRQGATDRSGLLDSQPTFYLRQLIGQMHSLADETKRTPNSIRSKSSWATGEEIRKLAICFAYFAWMCQKMGVDDLALTAAVQRLYEPKPRRKRKEEPAHGKRTH